MVTARGKRSVRCVPRKFSASNFIRTGCGKARRVKFKKAKKERQMIYLCGDTHGINEIGKITNKAFAGGLSADDFVIVLGDFGLFWSERIDEFMARKNIERYFPATLLFIDGNHENFDMLDELPRERKFGGTVGVGGENIFGYGAAKFTRLQGDIFCASAVRLASIRRIGYRGLAGGRARFRARRSLLVRYEMRAISSLRAGGSMRC